MEAKIETDQMDADMWASLPHDLLIEIFRLLGATAVIRSAGTCRPWRRAIIAGASCLHPHPDSFNPNLLIGFFHKTRLYAPISHVWLEYVPGPFEEVLAGAATNAAWPYTPHNQKVGLSTADSTDAVDIPPYNNPLTSRDGLLLLGRSTPVKDLCLCTPIAGTCRIIPAAVFTTLMYVLVTGAGDDHTAVWILAVDKEADVRDGVGYQVFSSWSGEWGPVRRSAKIVHEEMDRPVYVAGKSSDVAVCQGSVVYWLVTLVEDHQVRRRMLAMDVRTEQTWTTEIPEKYVDIRSDDRRIVPATSMDGRLSLIIQLRDQTTIEVWVLIGDGEWNLQRKMDLQSLLISDWVKERQLLPEIKGFCPRSGYLFGNINNKDLLIDINTGSLRPAGRFGVDSVNMFPYDMDWSTYISKMNYF